MMDQSAAKESRSDLGEQQDESTVDGVVHSNEGIRNKYERIKNVFRILIEEAPYLIDDKTFEKCEGKPLKEQFSYQIDGVRKALGIDQMEDVELLVDCFYDYESVKRKEEEEKDKEELEEIAEAGEEMLPEEPADAQKIKSGAPGRIAAKTTGVEGAEDEAMSHESEEVDPNALDLWPEHVVDALNAFEGIREQKAIEEAMNGTAKKKNTAETEEQKAAKEKVKMRLLWEKYTTILDNQKLSVWRSLDKALMKYYSMLVNRQNLIEETGLLNQQNEELKTLLN